MFLSETRLTHVAKSAAKTYGAKQSKSAWRKKAAGTARKTRSSFRKPQSLVDARLVTVLARERAGQKRGKAKVHV